MGIPQLNTEGTDQTGTTTSFTVSFTGLTWAANDIIEIALATDGYVPTLATANGFQLAQDPVGNTASVTTNAGTAGAADCGMFVFWKRATGNNTTADPPPVFNAATGGGTCWCLEPNSYSGARTTGTPYHKIAIAILGTASTAIAPPAVTPTLNNCLLMTRVAGSNDDATFNNWSMPGSAGPPSGTVASGWHVGSGNACSFTGDDGGYATAGGARSGTCTFGTSTKQAQITLVMASIAEASAALDDDGPAQVAMVAPRATLWQSPADTDFPGTAPIGTLDEDAGAAPLLAAVAAASLGAAPAAEEMPGSAASGVVDEASAAPWTMVVAPAPLGLPASADDLLVTAAATIVDDGQPPSRLAVQPSAAFIQSPAVDDLPVAAVTAAIAAAGGIQRSNDAPPATGTMTTGTIPAWAAATAYVVDASVSGISRVQNGGNIYQCSADGTSASSGGGPSGTSTAIGDGSATWYFVGPAFSTSTPAGSQVLACVMRGTQSVTPGGAITPTDNDGGSFSLIVNTAYLTFTTSFAGVWRRSAASNVKSGYAVSGQFGSVGAGQGDEMTLGWVALQGVAVGAPHAFSQVERASPTSGSVTAANITTTVRCLVVSFWFGNGNVQTVGAQDTAAPAGGLALVANACFPLSIAAPGYIQVMVGSRIADPGTFAESWTAVTNEGAQLVTVAFEIPGGVFEDAAQLPVVMWARPPVLDARAADDELPVLAALDEGGAVVAMPPVALQAPAPAVASDEITVAPASIVDEDGQLGAPLPPIAAQPAAPAAGDDLPIAAALTVVDEDALQPVAPQMPTPLVLAVPTDDVLPVAAVAPIVDEDGQAAPQLTAAAALFRVAAADDDLPVAAAATIVVDDGQPVTALSLAPQSVRAAPADDDLPIAAAAAIVDDDNALPAPMPLAPLGVWLARAADDELPIAAALEDAAWTFAVSWAPVALPGGASPADELPAPVALEDIGASRPNLAPIAWAMRTWSADDELVPFVAPPPIVDEDQPVVRAPESLPILSWLIPYDEVLAQFVVPTTPIDGDEVQIIILNTEVAVKLLESTFRQNSTHRPLQGIAFNAVAKIDFPTEFPGGITLKMVNGTTVITGPATGDAFGVWSYAWQPGDLATPGVYSATITATDGAGKPETFPTSTNMEITVLATL